MFFYYEFPAVKGKQAFTEYYICMIPCGLLYKLFPMSSEDILPEYRAQRRLNENRIPEIKNYILNNRDSYVFSALAASIDGEFNFEENKNGLGLLKVDMNAKFLINDGQHRNAAIQEAIKEDPTIGEESISVVFFADKGLARSQQMFTDLNKYAIKPSKSQNTFYDHKDLLAIITKNIITSNDFLRDYIDVENDSLGKYSAKLFTLSSFYVANQKIVSNKVVDDSVGSFCKEFWNELIKNIIEYQMLISKELSKKSLREDYLVTQNIILYAFGKLGNFFLTHQDYDMKKYLKRLQYINWLRSNKEWEGIAIEGGKIMANTNHINLTYLKIKQFLKLDLEDKEKLLLEGYLK